MTKRLLVIVAIILAVGAIGYTVGQQVNMRETKSALAEIELALAENQRQQMEAQTLMLMYQTKSTQLYQRIDSIWRSVDAGGISPGMANLETKPLYAEARKYLEMAEQEAERLDQLQVEHERLLKQKLELLGK